MSHTIDPLTKLSNLPYVSVNLDTEYFSLASVHSYEAVLIMSSIQSL